MMKENTVYPEERLPVPPADMVKGKVFILM